MNRRNFYRYLTLNLAGLMALALAIPGVAYLLDPLLSRRKKTDTGKDEYHPIARLSDLATGAPRSFAVIAERQDAWVHYPPEPIGSVWLIRQPAGSKTPVVAFTAECPHLGCAVGLAPGGKSFLCPCHTSAFDLEGRPKNAIPPRGMDRLEVQLSSGADPVVSVLFQRFRTMEKEKIAIV